MLNLSLSRRTALQVGSLGALGLSLPNLLRAEAARGGKNSVLLVYLGGGISHHDTFDLKPLAPEEVRGKYQPIDSVLPGLPVGELLPNLAKVMNKVALIRSGAHNNDHHETATNWALSGRFGSAFGDWPAIGAVAAHEIGFGGKMPPYVSIPRNPSFTWELGKSAFLGGRCESFKAGDPNAANYQVRDISPGEPLTESRTQRRQSLLSTVDTLAKRVEGNDQISTYDEFQQRAAALVLSPHARQAFAIDQEKTELRDRYGRNTFGQSCLLGRRLIEAGVRFVTVNYGGWDHHAKIFEGLDKKLPEFDAGLSALIDDLQTRGLFENTLLAVFGEFGRTPKINKDAGRDHWAPAGSLLFAGCGVRAGKIIGKTDKEGAYATERPVAPADVAHTIYEVLGIDPRKQIYTPDGRPVEILDSGETIRELFQG